MHRRDFLALLSTPALLALLQACSSDEAAPDGTVPPRGSLARSDLRRTPTDPDEALEASFVLVDFGTRLYRQLATDRPTGNIVISPVSLAIALSMVLAGAGGDTAAQLATAMGTETPDTLPHAMNALIAQLAARNADGTAVAVESSLWAQYDVTLRPTYLDVIAAEYGTGVHLVDFRRDADGARDEINEWVGEQTVGLIPELIPEGAVDAETRLALVNAIYMKASWLQPFDEASTTDQPFTTTDGTTIQVPTMSMRTTIPYASGDGWQAIDLAYDSHDLTLVLMLPEEGTLAQFEAEFLVSGITPYMSPTDVHLELPRFGADTAMSLVDVLQRLGVEDLFGDADLSGMSDDELRVADVLHQAVIAVDEAGTEAAAATAVIAPGTGAPSETPPVELRFDRPFLFAVRDRSSESHLFLGRIGDPTS